MITSKSVSVLSNAVHGSVLMVTVFGVLKKTLIFKGEILKIKHLKVDSFRGGLTCIQVKLILNEV